MARSEGVNFKELERQAKARDFEIGIEGTSAVAGGGDKRARRFEHPLDLWYRRKSISQKQYDAGCWLRDTCEEAQKSPPSSAYDGVPPPEHYGPASVTDAQVVASRKLEAARGHLGLLVYRDLQAFCCEGSKVDGTPFDRGTWRGRITAALDLLAHYRGM